MNTYAALVLVNVGPDAMDRYQPDSPLALVTMVDGSPALQLIVAADTDAAALEAVWSIGNRMGADKLDQHWPSDIRSMCTGDVVVLDRVYDAPADAASMLAHSPRHAVASCGYELAGRDNALVALNGTRATSRD